MRRYASETIQEVRCLRSEGKTYGEINKKLQLNVPKSTLSEWCKSVALPANYAERIDKLNKINLHKGQVIALEINRIKREELIKSIDKANLSISQTINSSATAKVALAMLCLGEASKSRSSPSFYFGNSDPKIIVLFIELMKFCFAYNIKKVRCTVQCRADQNVCELESYWQDITKIPKEFFYLTRVDPRTKGKPTKRTDYKGVLRIDYFDSRVRLELESLASLIYNQLTEKGP